MKTTFISLFMLILVVGLAAITQSVDFNNTTDLATYFNNSYAGSIGHTILCGNPSCCGTSLSACIYSSTGFISSVRLRPSLISSSCRSTRQRAFWMRYSLSDLICAATSSLIIFHRQKNSLELHVALKNAQE